MYKTLPLFCRVWHPARLSSAGSDTPQGLVLRGLIPRRILFCGVSDPTGKLRPRRTRQKKFENFLFSLKEHFSKIGCTYKLHYPRHLGFKLKVLSIWIFFCVLQGLIPRRTTFKFEYLREFEPEFDNVLGYELGANMGSIHEKNLGPNISCYCTFKAHCVATIKLRMQVFTKICLNRKERKHNFIKLKISSK